MERVRIGLAVLVSLLLFAPAAQAATIFLANLTNDQETNLVVPTLTTGAPRPESFGTAELVLNDDMTALSMVLTIYNIDVTGTQTADINDNLVNAHIHAAAPPGVNAGVVWGFIGAPFSNINPNDGVLTPFATGVGGTFTGVWNATEGNGGTNLAGQLTNLLSGLAYINIHTVQFPAGEIRGQIIPTPEPSTLLLVALGGSVLIGRRLRRRR